MDEIYDVVDKKGKKIGNATWTQVHTQGLLHQTVHGLVFSDPTRDKILIQKRSKNAAQGPGQMESSVAGHLIAGESARTGIRRELEEELFGLKSLPTNIKIKKICSYFNNDLPGNYEIAHLFEIIYSGPVQRQVEETEQPPMWVKWNFLVKDVKSKPQKYAKYFQNDIAQYILYRRGKDESSVEIISERHH